MKVNIETHTTITRVGLTKEEIKILSSAQNILNKIWDELEKADTLEHFAQEIYNDIDEIDYPLGNIINIVDVED